MLRCALYVSTDVDLHLRVLAIVHHRGIELVLLKLAGYSLSFAVRYAPPSSRPIADWFPSAGGPTFHLRMERSKVPSRKPSN